jgi:hypothetical protein
MSYLTKGAQFHTISTLSLNLMTLPPLFLPSQLLYPLPLLLLLPLLTYLFQLFLLPPLIPSAPFTLLS